MFYDTKEKSLRILGVYRVKSSSESMSERKRLHSAISLRIKGKSSFFYGENGNIRKDAADGTVTYLPAGLDYHRVTGGSEERIVIHLAESVLPQEMEIETVHGCEGLTPDFEALLREWESGEITSYNRSMQLLYGIFTALQTQNGENETVPRAIIAGVRLMENSFRNPELKISTLAKASHVSETYFRRVYGEHFGISPVKALSELRFGYAIRLLSTGYYKISEVAWLSGFSDAKYFRSAFRKRYGVPPSKYIADINKF